MLKLPSIPDMTKKLFSLLYIVPVFILIKEFASSYDLLVFIDFSSFLFVLVPTCLATIIGSRHSRRTSITCMFWCSTLSGVLGLLIGVVSSLSSSYNDPQAIMPGLAVSLLPLFYGMTISLLALPFYLIARSK